MTEKDNDHSRNEADNKPNALRDFAYVSQIGFTMAASLFVAVIIGRFLDRHLGTSPLFLLIFSLLGLISAFFSLAALSNKKK